MEIQISNKYCILTPLSPNMDARDAERLKYEIEQHKGLIIGLDLSFVENCTIEFFETIKNLNASCFNIHSDIFTLFNIMKLDKIVSLYTTEEDFKSNTRRLLNRSFQLLKIQ